MQRRAIGLHTQAVCVEAACARAQAIADFVCARLMPAAADALGASVQVELAQEPAAAAEQLMRELTSRLVWHYRDGLALHAAALELNGRVLLFPGASGGGKSTLAAYLAARGAHLLSDELVFVPHASRAAHALARPVHLKPGSLFLLEQFPALAANALRYAQGALLPVARLQPRADPPPLAAIVYPQYAPAGAAQCERLTPGLAGFSLAAALVNARNLASLGMPECARLAAELPCFRLCYRTLEEASALLSQVERALARA